MHKKMGDELKSVQGQVAFQMTSKTLWERNHTLDGE